MQKYNIVKHSKGDKMKSKIIAMRVEKEEYEQIEILRRKHFINTSELFRKTIRDLYDKLERQGVTDENK